MVKSWYRRETIGYVQPNLRYTFNVVAYLEKTTRILAVITLIETTSGWTTHRHSQYWSKPRAFVKFNCTLPEDWELCFWIWALPGISTSLAVMKSSNFTMTYTWGFTQDEIFIESLKKTPTLDWNFYHFKMCKVPSFLWILKIKQQSNNNFSA